jgi:hypothetical protein
VIDTPASDPVLPDGFFKGSPAQADPGPAWPITQAPDLVDLTLQWVGANPASIKVVYDNAEVWQYDSPALAIQNAVVLSWPATSEKFVLECAADIDKGPWQIVANPWCRTNAGQLEVSIPAPDTRQFYRLRFNP